MNNPTVKKKAPIKRIVDIKLGSDVLKVEETLLPCGTIVGRKVLNEKPRTKTEKAKQKFQVERKIALNEPIRPAIERNPHSPNSGKDLHPIEFVRAGDVYLFRVDCPDCKDVCAVGFPELGACSCGYSFSGMVIDIAKIRSKRNIVALVYKKERQRRISKTTVRSLLSLQENMCAYCDSWLKNYHVDHITPVLVGGSNHITNLAIACPTCNQTASSKCFTSFIAKKNYILEQRKRSGA